MRPPDDKEPSALFTKLLEMPRPSEVIDFPRLDSAGQPVGRIRIQVLTSVEHDKAREQAQTALKKRGFDKEDMTGPAIREVLADMVAKELIAMACLTERDFSDDPKVPMYAREFRGAKDVDQLRADEILILFNAYQLVQNKYGPFEKNLDDGDTEAWIQRIGEGAAEFPLLRLPSPQLAQLAQSLGARIYTLYRTLESQSESLPTSLASLLPDSFTATGLFGSRADGSAPPGSGSNEAEPVALTLDSARQLAENMRDRNR